MVDGTRSHKSLSTELDIGAPSDISALWCDLEHRRKPEGKINGGVAEWQRRGRIAGDLT